MTPNAYHQSNEGEELLPLDPSLYTFVYFCPSSRHSAGSVT